MAGTKPILFFVLFAIVTTVAFAEQKKAAPDVSKVLMEHVADAKEWHPIPFLKPIHLSSVSSGNLKIPFTRHILMMLIVLVLLFFTFIPAFSTKRILPNKAGHMLEPVVIAVRDILVYPGLGKELGDKWLPFFLTTFFFILFANLLGIIPAFSTLTGNLSITIALAAIILPSMFIQGMASLGFIGFFKNLVPGGLPWPFAIFIFIIEFAELFIKSAVLAIRLFANMIAGHLVIGSLLIMMFIVHPLTGIITVPMAVFIDLLEVLIAVIQAVVFTMLSAIFLGSVSRHQH